jgi:antitoxin ParD1/3/4
VTENPHLTPERQPEDADATQQLDPLAAMTNLKDKPRMTELSISVHPALERFLEARLAEGRFADAGDYIRDLIRRDLAEADEDAAWVRARIAEGEASGYLEADARDVLKEIMTKLPDA